MNNGTSGARVSKPKPYAVARGGFREAPEERFFGGAAVAVETPLSACGASCYFDVMRSKVTVALCMVAALVSAASRLPAAPCLVTNSPGPKACAAECCANKACCRTSQQRTGPPVQPLVKSAGEQQATTAFAVTVSAPLHIPFRCESQIVLPAERSAHSPPRRTLLCTFLI